jgi:serine/threonine-protein kinase
MAGDVNRDALLDLIADGAAVDWLALLDACRTDEERAVIEQFRVVSEIGRATDLHSATSTCPIAPVRAWGPLDHFEALGRGAYGTVFRARDRRLDREVALKLAQHHTSGDAPLVAEAQLLARIRHPNVVVVHGADVFDETPGLWMELIRGRSLRAIVDEHGPFGPREAALIALDVCAALAAVHRAGLLHRDIKANNVMREVGGRIVLMDFGAGKPAAAPSGDGGTTGTPLYMAPELFTGGDASVATDIYAVGVLLFFLVTGDYPVIGRTLDELRARHSSGRRWLRELRPEIPATLAQVADRALSTDPVNRFRTAAEMEQALATTLDVHGRATFHEAQEVPFWRRWAARPIPTWVALVSAPILVAGTLFVARIVDRPQVASRDEVVPSFWAGGFIPRARQPLSRAQWEIIDGHQELAGSLADRGQWAQAAAHYQKVTALLLAEGWQDEPYRAHVMAMLGWAETKAGTLDDARLHLDSALYMLAQEAGMNHPLRATMEMASAVERYVRGDLRASAEAMMRAIQIRHDALAAAGIAVRSPAIEVTQLTEALARHAPDADSDGDWLPDAIETAVGLKPTDRDSDGDGTPDDEEDLNGDAINNAVEWGIVADPRHVLGHFGGLDPERAGFRRERDFTAGPIVGTGPAAWKMTAQRQGFYYQKLTESQKHAAVARGWRLISIGTLHEGIGAANLDLDSPARFIQNFHVAADRNFALQLVTSIVPLEGPIVSIADAPGAWPLTESVFDPFSHTASASVAGRRVATGYRGCTQFMEHWGLVMAAANFVATAPPAEADFSLVLLQIR